MMTVFPTPGPIEELQLEELVFQIASTESLGGAGGKAAKLVARGARRVFALDLQRVRVLEWSREQGRWSLLERGRAEGEVIGEAKALLVVLVGRGLEPSDDERRRIVEERDVDRIERWLAAAATCADIAELLALP